MRKNGRIATTVPGGEFGIPSRTIRRYLDILLGHGLLQAHGERKGRYLHGCHSRRDATAPATQGGEQRRHRHGDLRPRRRIEQRDLRSLVKKLGYDGRVIGSLHGRRLAHLRKDAKTGENVLTSRGAEVAKQHLFAEPLSRQARESIGG